MNNEHGAFLSNVHETFLSNRYETFLKHLMKLGTLLKMLLFYKYWNKLLAGFLNRLVFRQIKALDVNIDYTWLTANYLAILGIVN